MTILERKSMVVGAIRKLEDKLVSLKHCEYDGTKGMAERQSEMDSLQSHLHCAHSVLVLITEEEIEVAS